MVDEDLSALRFQTRIHLLIVVKLFSLKWELVTPSAFHKLSEVFILTYFWKSFVSLVKYLIMTVFRPCWVLSRKALILFTIYEMELDLMFLEFCLGNFVSYMSEPSTPLLQHYAIYVFILTHSGDFSLWIDSSPLAVVQHFDIVPKNVLFCFIYIFYRFVFKRVLVWTFNFVCKFVVLFVCCFVCFLFVLLFVCCFVCRTVHEDSNA